MTRIARDVRLALRTLRRRPGFSGVVVATLALGIGASTAIFSILHGLLLRELPYESADRIVVVQEERQGPEAFPVAVSYQNFGDWKERVRALRDLTLVRYGTSVLTGGDEATRVATNFVTADYFAVFGAGPSRGRLIDASEAVYPEPAAVAVVSHTLWRTRFGSDPGLVGASIEVGGAPLTVVGILEAGFADPFAGSPFTGGSEEVGLFLPLGLADRYDALGAVMFTRRQVRRFTSFARIAEGSTLEAARQEIDAVAAGLEQAYPDSNRGFGVLLSPLRSQVAAQARGPLMVLMAGAVILLLIACFNVANLLVVRGVTRASEVALRQALGAGRSELLRQFTTETMVLAVAGGGLGVFLAGLTIPALLSLSPIPIPTIARIGVDGTVLATALAASVLTGLVFGLLPALRGTADGLRGELGGSRRGGAARTVQRLRGGIVIFEVATAMVLLVSATLVLSGFRSLRATDPGYLTERLLTLQIDLSPGRYGSPEAQVAFVREATARLTDLPGVEWADFWGPGRPGLTFQFQTIVAEGQAVERQSDALIGRYHLVNPGGIARMGMEIVRGRELSLGDRSDSRPVAVINESLAEALWPGQDPIGRGLRRFEPPGAARSDNPTVEVAGVARDAALGGRTTTAGVLATDFDVFYPVEQQPTSTLTVLVRAVADAEAVLPEVRDELARIDDDLALYNVSPMDDHMAAEEGSLRFAATLLGAFGVLALALAALGVYGVLSYAVAQRRREIGLRAALGAEAARTVALFVRRGVTLAVLGIVLGVVGALALSRTLGTVLAGVATPGLASVLLPGSALLVVAALACWIPARRAASVAPAVALQAE